MKNFYTFIFGISLLAATFMTALVPGVSVNAASAAESVCKGSGGTWATDQTAPNGGVCSTPGDTRTVPSTIQQLTDVLIFLVGAIAVLMIIIGGVRYVVSAGDQAALTSAKNTILYAVIGLTIAFMAYAIVHFIFTAFNIK